MFPEILEPFEGHSCSLTASAIVPSGFKRATPTRDTGSHGARCTLCTLVPIPPRNRLPHKPGARPAARGVNRGGRGHSHQPLKGVWKQGLPLRMVLRTRQTQQVVGPGPLHCEACIHHSATQKESQEGGNTAAPIPGKGKSVAQGRPCSQSPSPNPKVHTNQLSSHTRGVSDECGPTCSGLPARGHRQTPSEAARRAPSGQEGPSRAAANTGLSSRDATRDCTTVKHNLSDRPGTHTQRTHKAVLTAQGQGSGPEQTAGGLVRGACILPTHQRHEAAAPRHARLCSQRSGVPAGGGARTARSAHQEPWAPGSRSRGSAVSTCQCPPSHPTPPDRPPKAGRLLGEGLRRTGQPGSE